jgi:hypothetical protein
MEKFGELIIKNGDKYISILTTSAWDNLFSKEIVEKLGELIIKLNMKRTKNPEISVRRSLHRLLLA